MDSLAVTQRLEQAVALAQAGQKKQAEVQLRDLVAAGSRLPRVCMALGVLCGERGDRTERRLWLAEARRLEEAQGGPPSLRLLLNQLVDALEHGEPLQALAYGEEALGLYPEDGEVHVHQAQVLRALDRLEEAHQHLRQARDLLRACSDDEPATLKGWRLLATAEHHAERFDQATEAYSRALSLDPNHLPTLLALSRLLINRGSIDEAMPWLMNALAVAPEDVEVLCYNGFALKSLGEIEQAIELFRQALAIQPSHVASSQFLASCLMDQGLSEEAGKVYREVLAQDPNHLDCRLGLAISLRSLGDMEESLAIQWQMLQEAPQALGLFACWMFTTSISDIVPAAEVLATAHHFWTGQGVNEEARAPLPASPRVGTRPLRVGLLSADIGNHVVGRFLDPLLRHHDPNRCQLELLSMRRLYDQASDELASLADGVHNLEGLPVQDARARLRQHSYDLIIDTSGYTRGSGLHLLAERCAPVQAHYIGYHATTGLPTMDAFIGDQETAAPELQDQFSERLWRLPRPWLAYPLDPAFPDAIPLMQTDRPVLGAFCQVGKLSDATLAIWAEALRRVPEAILVLKDRGLQDPAMRQRLEDRLAGFGVHPGRVTFLAPLEQWTDHVDHYNILDVALDTTPWSSATTGFEALAMGVPLVAIRGNRMASRMSSSLVRGVGREEWIGDTPEAIATIVAELCSDLPELRRNKATRQRNALASSLFDGVDLSNQLMDLFEDLVAHTPRLRHPD